MERARVAYAWLYDNVYYYIREDIMGWFPAHANVWIVCFLLVNLILWATKVIFFLLYGVVLKLGV